MPNRTPNRRTHFCTPIKIRFRYSCAHGQTDRRFKSDGEIYGRERPECPATFCRASHADITHHRRRRRSPGQRRLLSPRVSSGTAAAGAGASRAAGPVVTVQRTNWKPGPAPLKPDLRARCEDRGARFATVNVSSTPAT